SESELQRQLPDARIARGRNTAEARIRNIGSRVVEIHPVEQVEKLGTKLEFHALAAHPNLLEQAAVIRDQVGTTESPFTERAISAHGRQHKRRGVEVVNAKGPRRPAGAWCQRIA